MSNWIRSDNGGIILTKRKGAIDKDAAGDAEKNRTTFSFTNVARESLQSIRMSTSSRPSMYDNNNNSIQSASSSSLSQLSTMATAKAVTSDSDKK
jgi:hypothetical protein